MGFMSKNAIFVQFYVILPVIPWFIQLALNVIRNNCATHHLSRLDSLPAKVLGFKSRFRVYISSSASNVQAFGRALGV